MRSQAGKRPRFTSAPAPPPLFATLELFVQPLVPRAQATQLFIRRRERALKFPYSLHECLVRDGLQAQERVHALRKLNVILVATALHLPKRFLQPTLSSLDGSGGSTRAGLARRSTVLLPWLSPFPTPGEKKDNVRALRKTK
eukprot:CAMPEP_0113285818 /NCGR_PEP_ID=MMETSP0008_2-20120614/30794_1 /TAXON_ID=97485 /ORGANISM="Prymnesium parvum" /LENGTH=141 /DNA_ID=CAMNT_0000136841 /DNA_START=160 /DNA_END=583 /DNA_ORIENTATION=+ /assembly_acc=CAM_ASM_000153